MGGGRVRWEWSGVGWEKLGIGVVGEIWELGYEWAIGVTRVRNRRERSVVGE